jgi:hypothetical protein
MPLKIPSGYLFIHCRRTPGLRRTGTRMIKVKLTQKTNDHWPVSPLKKLRREGQIVWKFRWLNVYRK